MLGGGALRGARRRERRRAGASAVGSVAGVAGLFVTFEGIDRSGKTTQARMLCETLGDEALAVREPGGTAVGERVRELVKDESVEVGPEAEALLFAAARAELVARVIVPALSEDRIVVSDRYLDSSLAYQGAARGLGVESVAMINGFATGGLVPDLTFLLALDPGAAVERAGGSDRFEAEGTALQASVLEAYEVLAADDPGRWRRIDADRPAEDVHGEVLEAVRAARPSSGAGRAEATRTSGAETHAAEVRS